MPHSPETKEMNGKGEYTPEIRNLSSVLVLIKCLWTMIAAYSFLVSKLTGCHWWEMIAHYIGFLACFYLWHWQAHVALSFIPFNKECRRLHSIHHWQIYPPNQFFGPEKETDWQSGDHTSSFSSHEALLYLLIASQAALAFCFGEKPLAVGFALLFAIAFGYFGMLLHRSFHIRGHWLERFSWFHVLRSVHYVHHIKSTRHNYAVLNIGLDWLMGTLVLSDLPAPPEKSPAAAPSHTPKESDWQAPGIGSLAALSLGLGPHHRDTTGASWAMSRGPAAVLLRFAIIAALLVAWLETQALIAYAPPAPAAVGVWDLGHALIPQAAPADRAATQRAVLLLQAPRALPPPSRLLD
jgi:hypothetical protein